MIEEKGMDDFDITSKNVVNHAEIDIFFADEVQVGTQVNLQVLEQTHRQETEDALLAFTIEGLVCETSQWEL